MSPKSGPLPIRKERTLGDILGDALSANAHPEPAIVSAALGDTDAQRDLANSSFNDAERLTGLAALLSCMEALTFARLAAAGGESRSDSLSAVFLWGEVSRRCMDLGDPDLAVHFEANGLLMAEAIYERNDGRLGLIGIETKYSESCEEPTSTAINPRHEEIVQTSGLFVEPMSAALRSNPVQQLFREHLLAQAAVDRGDYAEAWFVLIAPRLNHLVQNAARYYARSLVGPTEGQVPFVNVELEEVIAAYRAAGQPGHASALHDRYTDWWLVDTVIRDAIKAQTEPTATHDAA